MMEFADTATARSTKRCRIAALINQASVFHAEVGRALRLVCDTNADLQVDLATYTVDYSNRRSIMVLVEKLLELEYDIIIPVGLVCSRIVHELTQRKGGHPTIFVGCGDPVRANLVASMERPRSFSTAVIREPIDQLETIRTFLPISQSRKSLLLPYTPWSESGAIAEQVVKIKNYIASNSDMMVLAVPVSTSREVIEAFKKHAGRYDAAMLLEAGAGHEVTSQLAEIAWQNKAVFCTSWMRSLRYGAACVMAGDLMPYANAVFELVKQFAVYGKNLGAVPVTVLPQNQRFYINTDMLARVGMTQEQIDAFCDRENVTVLREWQYITR